MSKQTIKSVGDIERAKMLGRNEFNAGNEYDITDTFESKGGNANDAKERIKQMGRSEYNGNDEYGIDKVDL